MLHDFFKKRLKLRNLVAPECLVIMETEEEKSKKFWENFEKTKNLE